MRLSFNTWVYCSFPTWLPVRSLDEVIDVLARIGYDGVEIGGAAPHGYPDYLDVARRQAIRQRLADRGISAAAICPALGGAAGYNPVSVESAERAASREYLDKLIRLAADLGCPRVIWLAGYRRYGQDPGQAWQYAVEGLRESARVAADNGVQLAVEPTPMDSNMLEDASDCLKLLADAEVPPESAGVMLDTAHIFHRQDDVRAAIREAGARLVHVHACEQDRQPPGTYRDFGSVVDELQAIGYDGYLSMEVGFNRREVDPDDLARRSIDHIRDVMARVPRVPAGA